MTRRFVALPVPAQLRAALDARLVPLRAGWDGCRPTRADGWHATLAFLGEVADEDLPAAVEAVRGALMAAPLPTRVSLGSGGRFGRSVLWCGLEVEPAGALEALGEAVQASCETAGLPVQRRAVHPHVTLARARRHGTVPVRAVTEVTDAVEALVATTPMLATWRPAGIEVWASHLGDGAARYLTEALVPG